MTFLAGLLAGAAIGSAGALLLAPRSGRDTRGSLSREAKRYAVRLSGLHPQEWNDIADEENGRNLIANLEHIRSAGL
jgi:gas vesicle protein